MAHVGSFSHFVFVIVFVLVIVFVIVGVVFDILELPAFRKYSM